MDPEARLPPALYSYPVQGKQKGHHPPSGAGWLPSFCNGLAPSPLRQELSTYMPLYSYSFLGYGQQLTNLTAAPSRLIKVPLRPLRGLQETRVATREPLQITFMRREGAAVRLVSCCPYPSNEEVYRGTYRFPLLWVRNRLRTRGQPWAASVTQVPWFQVRVPGPQ